MRVSEARPSDDEEVSGVMGYRDSLVEPGPLPARMRLMVNLVRVLRKLHLAPGAMPADPTQASPKTRRGAAPKATLGPVPSDVLSSDTMAAGVPVRVYRAARGSADTQGAAVLYIHGGGWVMGSPDSIDHLCRRVASVCNVPVLSVDYRLAPEHPFPAALDDCWTALNWLRDGSSGLEVDPARIAIGGDSAGGNLAAALALKCLAEGVPLLGQALIYPALDFTYSHWLDDERLGILGLSSESLTRLTQWYVGDHDPREPFISPLFAPSLVGLPPALILTAGWDHLRVDGAIYADQLENAGVPVTFVDYPSYAHGFFSLPKLYPGIEAAWSVLTGWISGALAGTLGQSTTDRSGDTAGSR